MSKDFVKLHREYADWGKLIAEADQLEDCTDEEKRRIKEALAYLRGELGKSFLLIALQARHPIIENVINHASWTRLWFVWLAKAIKELKKQQNWEIILGKFKTKRYFSEAMSILELVVKFSRAGFEVYVLKPKVDEKTSDLKLLDPNTQEKIFVEVSTLGISKEQETAWMRNNELSNTFHSGQVYGQDFCILLLKVITNKELVEIQAKIKAVMQRMRTTGKGEYFIIENIVKIAVAPEGDEQFVRKWRTVWGLGENVSLDGAWPSVDEGKRIRRKLRKKQKQLPSDKPGIVVLHTSVFFFYDGVVEWLLKELSQKVRSYSHIVSLVVSAAPLFSGDKRVETGENYLYVQKERSRLILEQNLLMFNPEFTIPISGTANERILTAFKDW